MARDEGSQAMTWGQFVSYLSLLGLVIAVLVGILSRHLDWW